VVGEPLAFRNLQYGLSALALAGWLFDRAGWATPLSRGAWLAVLVASLLWCEATSLSRFLAFQVNGVDFSTFDWMLVNTARGHFGYSPIYSATRSGVNHFGVHSSFLLLALVPLEALAPSPLWLVLLGPLAVWAGVFPLRRLVRWSSGEHGGLLLAAILAFVANAWVGRLVSQAFRIESLVPALSLWFLVGWVERRPAWWAPAAVALLLTKEDAALFLAAFAAGAALVERPRWRGAVALVVGCAGWLVLYTRVLQPLLLGRPPTYLGFWSEFGDTLPAVVAGQLTHPLLVLRKLLSSGLWMFFLPLAALPWASPRAAAAMAPTVWLLGTATYDLMHAFENYYPAPLVAFALFGVLDVLRRWRAAAEPARWREGLALAALLAFPLVAGGYCKVVPVDWSRREGLAQVREAIAGAPRVCVQTAIFPHLGYGPLEPLLDPACADVPGTLTVANPGLATWFWAPGEFDAAIARWRASRAVRELPGGFLVFGPP